jgi:hypothetical protein
VFGLGHGGSGQPLADIYVSCGVSLSDTSVVMWHLVLMESLIVPELSGDHNGPPVSTFLLLKGRLCCAVREFWFSSDITLDRTDH